MKNTFRYSLAEEDYLNCETFHMKKNGNFLLMFIFSGSIVFYFIYLAIVQKNVYYVPSIVFFIAFIVLYTIYLFKIKVKKEVKKYVFSDKSYLGLNEITIDDKAMESKNIPNENEAAIVTIYPYSIMKAIYETNEYFYFYIGDEVKILPKRVIPQEMQEAVFKAIKSNKNCIFKN